MIEKESGGINKYIIIDKSPSFIMRNGEVITDRNEFDFPIKGRLAMSDHITMNRKALKNKEYGKAQSTTLYEKNGQENFETDQTTIVFLNRMTKDTSEDEI